MGGCTTTTLQAKDIFPCLDALWTYKNATPTSLQNAFLAVEILTHLCDHPCIEDFGRKMRIPIRKQKMAAAFDIVSMMWNVWHVGKDTRKVAGIRCLQRNWRQRNTAILCGPYPTVGATNDTDPFTMEPLETLQEPNSVFSFWELSGGKAWRVWAFGGKDLYDYIFVHHNTTNPLTREPIPNDVIERLEKWNKIYGQPQQIYQTELWATPGVAFTQVSSELQLRHGIEIQPAWLIHLTISDLYDIILKYHYLVNPVSVQYMRDSEINTNADISTVRCDIAREMLYMIRREQSPSFFVCCLVFAISQLSVPLYESLPDWVLDAAEV